MSKLTLIDNTQTQPETIIVRKDLIEWAKETGVDLNEMVTNALIDLKEDHDRRLAIKNRPRGT